jgi:RNA polymerase sigma factor (sigma-70 family)
MLRSWSRGRKGETGTPSTRSSRGAGNASRSTSACGSKMASQERRDQVIYVEKDAPDGSPSPSKEMRRGERLDRLEAALRELNPDYRTAIQLVRIDGLPVKEAARRMKRTQKSVMHLRRRQQRRRARPLRWDLPIELALHRRPRPGAAGPDGKTLRLRPRSPWFRRRPGMRVLRGLRSVGLGQG